MKKNFANIAYHVIVVVLSAAFAFWLPDGIHYVYAQMPALWPSPEDFEIVLVSVEIIVAVILIVGLNVFIRSWNIGNRSRIAQAAGLVSASFPGSLFGSRRIRRLKQEQGHGRNLMLIGSTGFRTFGAPGGDLHSVLKNCREARIMLMNPLGAGVVARARSLGDPAITPESLREQIIRSIDHLKGLKAFQKNIRLKLYPDVPLIKMAILGDYLFLQHYPMGINVRSMPEYVLKHDRSTGLFGLFYQYFIGRWFDSTVPEYDLDSDDIVYRDRAGNEVRREKFNEVVMEF